MMRLTQSLFFTADWITNMEWIIEQLVYSLIMFLYHFLPTFCPRGYLLPSVFGFIVYLPVNLIHRQVLLPSDLLRVFVVIDVLLNLSYKWQMHSVLANAFSVGKYSGPVVTVRTSYHISLKRLFRVFLIFYIIFFLSECKLCHHPCICCKFSRTLLSIIVILACCFRGGGAWDLIRVRLNMLQSCICCRMRFDLSGLNMLSRCRKGYHHRCSRL